MAGTGPKIPNDPIDLLTPVLDRPEPFLNQFWTPTIFGSLAFIGICLGNWASRRPVLSGIHIHAGVTGIAAIAGTYVEEYRKDYLAERDAVLRHYIQLHPQDFPPPERKKFADVIEKWYPIR